MAFSTSSPHPDSFSLSPSSVLSLPPSKKPNQKNRVCPYAQRVLIALAEKGVPFDQLELAAKDPRTGQWRIPTGDAKPGWFTSLAPEGKVPAVLYMEERTVHVVTESLVILEFVEDYGNAASTSAASCSAPSLLPPHPATRAAARLAAKRFDERFVPPFYALLRGGLTAEDQKRHKQTLTEELEWLERHADAAVSFESWSFFSSFVVEGKVEKKNPENSHRKRKKKNEKNKRAPTTAARGSLSQTPRWCRSS